LEIENVLQELSEARALIRVIFPDEALD